MRGRWTRVTEAMTMRMRIFIVSFVLAASALSAHAGQRRALLIGINDYTASTIRMAARPAAPGRDWPNLGGAVNDVAILREMLVLLYGFDARDVVTLTDQAATREAILGAVERHLVAPAAKDDVLFFYYAGHGSQVRNTRSDEPDQLDESIIPADSRLGVSDIRDKELRRLFNRMLDRGARLTVLLDSCNSASGARGLPSGAPARGVNADLRDIRDATDYGPRPERRGALVLSSTEDFDTAQETRDREGQPHGLFTWAWIRALRDAPAAEPAVDTFLRVSARMRTESPYQVPVIAGTPAVQSAPFLGVRTDRRGNQMVIGVQKAQGDTVWLQGGWANGLSIGTQLRDPATNARVVVTDLLGLTRSEARLRSGSTRSGALMEVVAWAAPPGRPLRVWMPQFSGDMSALARALAAAAVKRGVRWIADPTESTPAHVLRWNGVWELVGGGMVSSPVDAIAKLPRGSSLFVQFPAPSVEAADDGIVAVARAEEADYILAGRYAGNALSYAWVRPAVRGSDARRSALPVRTAWVQSRAALREAVLRLRRIHAWYVLDAPPGSRAPFRLGLKGATGAAGGVLTGGERYSVVLNPASRGLGSRYVYVFVIDSHGTGTLLFPRDGSVENRLTAARELVGFEVGPPYGMDTYVLLTTEEPLPNPWVLSWEGVRSGLSAMQSEWSIERLFFESRRH
jgi:hypothetical protein